MAAPVTTVVPFASLPTCAQACGHLYDANGACVPPAAPAGDSAAYASCFCANNLLAPFSTGTAGVCDNACTAPTDQGGLASIQGWYTSFCSGAAKGVQTTTGTAATTTTTNGSAPKQSNTGHYTWISGHWQWVIFIVVMVVGIAGIWVGACVWHRRYLRKKDRRYALGNPLAVRASTGAASGTTGLHDPTQLQPQQSGQLGPHGAPAAEADVGVFAFGTPPSNAYDTEKRRSRLGRRHG
ncbi:hypothetical protein SPI_04631 [Niveomyces insectorum RCEF 264]|uniref:Integral membrane protein n=1 Tax=Niveomyces insectorum RCEF 264 TaxID=1081102 RepID=A0A167UPG8_9HYPO|nr:hypothetical protein SPI_04631 [Niveomyces insectorum RCEF 264]